MELTGYQCHAAERDARRRPVRLQARSLRAAADWLDTYRRF